MIGYCSYVVVALLMIYPHSTNQSIFSYESNGNQIEKELREELPKAQHGNFLKSLNKKISKTIARSTPPSDIVCDRLNQFQKQDLCNEAMKLMINKDHGNGTFHSFLKVVSDVPAPELANTDDPYTCRPIPIEVIDMEKRMYWCENRVWKNRTNGELYHADGFFMSGSQKAVKRAFMFRQSPTNSEKVVKWAKMDDVGLLEDVSTSFDDCCALCHRGRFSSSSRGH